MTNNPLSDQTLTKLFAAQIIALVGTGLSTIALALLAYNMAGGEAGRVLGVALAIKMIAYVFYAPIIGGIVHRLSRNTFMISMDLLRALIVLLMPFVSEIWHIYLLIFLLNLFSAGFKPVFQAVIPDILDDDEQYGKALAYSRIAYDLENILSPTLAGIGLLFFSYTGLFVFNHG
jgi:MFS family permease